MANWRDYYSGWDGHTFAHPDAPSGGGGPGHFRFPHPTGYNEDRWRRAGVPHPDSPEGQRITSSQLERADTLERARCVYEALTRAPQYAGPFILEETGYALQEVMKGILPGLVMALGILAASAFIGGLAGGIVGGLAGGVGAIPGAIAGSAVGAKLGLVILNFLGLGFLLAYVGDHIPRLVDLLNRAVSTAWDAPVHDDFESMQIESASRDFARALAVLVRLILEGIVAYLLAKGGAKMASSAVPELVARLKQSKLGEPFATWVGKN